MDFRTNLEEEHVCSNILLSVSDSYNPNTHPQIAHVFQSAAMRFGHTLVPPGVFRRSAISHSFIQDISIAPLQVHYYSEALPTTAYSYCVGVNTPKRYGSISSKALL